MNRRLPLMITCAEMDALLVDYLDGTLPARERRRLDIHVRLCADCNCFLKAYRATVALARSAFQGPADWAEIHRDVTFPRSPASKL